MLEPREADIPALFLFFVVLPVVTYILLGKWNEVLGKWNEASKKNSRVSKLAQLAAEEVNAAETMPAVDILQPVSMSMPNIGTHYCARCFSSAKTRCSRCKSVRYCSGKCQIIHWRQGHKQECEQWEKHKKPSATANVTPYENDSADASQKSFVLQHDLANHGHDYSSSDAASCIGRRSENEKDCQTKRNISTLEHDAGHSLEGAKDASATATHSVAVSTMLGSEHAYRRCKLGDESCLMSEDANDKQDKSSPMHLRISPDLRNMTTQELHPSMHQTRNTLESSSGITSFHSTKSVVDTCDSDLKLPSDRAHHSNHGFPLVAEEVTVKAEVKLKKPPYTVESSSSIKHATKLSRGHPVNGTDKNSGIEKESLISRPENNENCSSGDNVIASTRKSSLPQKHSMTGLSVDIMKTNKVLFPFEELIKFFQCEVYDVYPRGLLNCGNSCYANAVLQCLTCTKPLLVYLLRGVHSRSCCTKEWCLMCELELHVALLREAGGPVSPNKILSNMMKIGCHIGGGNQEDAHEFLRLLVMSMQSICLEGLGGEKEVDARLQDTTLIQQIFGGRLRSKVKCLRCELESERYEHIMDLTLEIHGWVESLEDALTQFTAPEDLDGDNMYRCGRCSTYVTARKQLNVHEAPNILTIVLKRFQTGRYGKINKCVTFPDMLDMIPFMTGTCDSPPLYMLYAVVVHLDTFNASFSGHYISYVKDLQGVWFRIDDTEVQPVDLSQVMSEGAYMLFYSRSFPRPPRLQSCKYTTTSMARNSTKPSISRPPKSSRYDNPKKSEKFSTRDAERDAARAGRHENIPDFIDQGSRSIDRNYARFNFGRKDSFLDSSSVDFSDTPHSSDWSIFTSSDESSFTTESTSDSFSTVDNSDTANLDPVSYIFNPSCLPEYNQKSNVSCTKQSRCKPHTRFFSEHRGSVLDSRMSTLLTDTVYKGRNPEHHLAAGNGVISSYARADMVVQR